MPPPLLVEWTQYVSLVVGIISLLVGIITGGRALWNGGTLLRLKINEIARRPNA